MPLPARTEQAAAALETLGDLLDGLVRDHVANGSPLPTETRLASDLRPEIAAGLQAAFREIGPYRTVDLVNAVEELMAVLLVMIRRTFREAETRRAEVRAAPEPEPDDDRSPLAIAAALGFAAAVLATPRPQLSREILARYAAASGAPLPMRLGPAMRQAVRTETAIARNGHAVNIARRDGLYLFVEDALNGPTDEPCERVNRRWATIEWSERHKVAHPNCTRRFKPGIPPNIQAVTLLA